MARGSAFQGEADMWVLVKGWVPADGGGLASTPIPKEGLPAEEDIGTGGLFVRRQVCLYGRGLTGPGLP